MGDLTATTLVTSLAAAQEAKDWERVLVLLREHWSDLVQHVPDALMDVIDALPPEVLARNSRLRLADQYLRRTTDRQPETRAYRDIVADDHEAAPLDRLAALTGRIAVARSSGRHRDAVVATDVAVSTLRSMPLEIIPTFTNALPEFHYHWGIPYLLDGRFDDALEQFVQSHDWAASVANHMVAARAAGAVALIHALHGRGRDAQAWLDKLPTIPEDAWWRSEASTPARLAEAILHTERLEPDAARIILDGIDIRLSLDYWGPFFAIRAFLTPDHPGDAQALLSEFDGFVSGLPPEYAAAPLNAEYTALVRYLLLQILHQNERATKALGDTRADANASITRQTGAALLALRLLRLDRRADARKLIAPLLHVSSARPRVLISALLIAAETDAVNEREALLQRATALAAWNRCHAVLAFCPAGVRDRLAEILRGCGEDDIADRLEAVTGRTPVAGADALTERENAVVRAALAGRSNAEIAAEQHVSVNTVKTHLRTAYRKLQVANREQLRQVFELGR